MLSPTSESISLFAQITLSLLPSTGTWPAVVFANRGRKSRRPGSPTSREHTSVQYQHFQPADAAQAAFQGLLRRLRIGQVADQPREVGPVVQVPEVPTQVQADDRRAADKQGVDSGASRS